MTDDPFCRHRWDTGDSSGPCQCLRLADHNGPHRCCCGQEDEQ